MGNFTFLTEELLSYNLSDIFNLRGLSAAITDFSILLGGWVDSKKSVENLEERTGCYWTKTDAGKNNVRGVSFSSDVINFDVHRNDIGARPVLVFSSIGTIPTNGKNVKIASDGVLEVEYGYYPQKAAPKDMQELLEKEYLRRKYNKNKK